jgi:hypothetical protein
MTNAQLYLAIGVPLVVNTVLSVMIYTLLSTRMTDGFTAVNRRIDDLNQRFDDMRDLWRAELRRVEEVLDARLKHLEDPRSSMRPCSASGSSGMPSVSSPAPSACCA